MPDRFANVQASLSGPAASGFAVTPNDTTDLPEPTRALYVGSGGDLTVRMLTGETLTFAAVSPGSLLPLRASRVFATGTSAANLVGLV
ncbi:MULTISPECIES: spike base protein, RCAP_Rcc01079 family [Pseudorhizobium]|jgi:hypothetical protein|uniref:Uncharacterized protein n=1 Tax=Pseudorhizobium pelagicum TaxID=1509405 RepID=A0A922T9U2_9HYPH|nr:MULTISPECIES: hypothetical protein [Pseudorhizobium]MBU1313354.1 hypothetical protein [Alphaproteobacteria bacterium]MDY6962290.1 hypothetical protein [Pseudomonadota bacterium]KEQ03751.1 hypothetical protein GV68_16135 [Pseudorhizobium pelagicum]KEQ05506.1 hypothetical protein GV67_05145 [Pseudorhizobium pelagicum]MBU1549709.1 hypothetical protein [Alphaproteobacteria bacterium]|tara:strand:+ start:869 stop:1132 length:264 start_codon:yes stop_codon:yes gene_type:complete